MDQIDGLYINTCNYELLLGGSYILLPKVLNNSMKGLVNLKNKDHKCFMWRHVRVMIILKIAKALNILLVTEKVELLNQYVLFYLKWVGI